MTDYSSLRFWTPISFHAGAEPRLEWGDLTALRFTGPFFDSALNEWRRSEPAATTTTDLAALDALDSVPSLDPALIIAHASRSGSTILAQIIGTLEGTVVVSEARAINGLLFHAMSQPDFPVEQALRKIVRALGRIRFGDERRLVLKLSSASTRFLPAFRRAFPGAPMVWLQRRPAEIVASQLRRPGPWLAAEGLSGDVLPRLILQRLSVVFLAAKAHVGDDMLLLDYRDLPDAAWTRVVRLVGIDATRPQVTRMQERARYHARTGLAFAPRGHDDLPGWAEAVVKQTIDPLYEALDRRRLAATVRRAFAP